ncbi:MAG: CbiX/SirB N-terminal domain-containing protein [Sandaracinaceae bacterium]
MRAVLLIDHGSRRDDANRVVEQVAEQLRAAHDVPIEIAHMEIAAPTIADGVAACVRAGATQIVAVPYFLGPGRHASDDLPRLVTEAVARYPGVSAEVTSPFGADARIVALVAERAGL